MMKRKKMRQTLKYKVAAAVINDPIQLINLKRIFENADQYNLVEETFYDDGSQSITIQIHYRNEIVNPAKTPTKKVRTR